jgi:hypothetical protein
MPAVTLSPTQLHQCSVYGDGLVSAPPRAVLRAVASSSEHGSTVAMDPVAFSRSGGSLRIRSTAPVSTVRPVSHRSSPSPPIWTRRPTFGLVDVMALTKHALWSSSSLIVAGRPPTFSSAFSASLIVSPTYIVMLRSLPFLSFM